MSSQNPRGTPPPPPPSQQQRQTTRTAQVFKEDLPPQAAPQQNKTMRIMKQQIPGQEAVKAKAQPLPQSPPQPHAPPLPASMLQPQARPPATPRQDQAQAAKPTAGAKVGNLKVEQGAMLGSILVDNGCMTNEQRLKCLEIQAKAKEKVLFGDIAVRLGFVTKETIEQALKSQKQYVEGVRDEQSRRIELPEAVQKQMAKSAGTGKIAAWISSALQHHASDLHLMTGKPLVLRHTGRLIVSREQPIPAKIVKDELVSILDEEERNLLKERRCIVKTVDLPGGGRARCNIFYHLGGMNGVFRLIPSEIPSLVGLNLPSVLGKFTTYSQGLVLVTGPIGSGKTTTLASILEIINRERQDHIITVEKPIEFVFKNRQSLITQRQVGSHTNSYSNALRAALREDPDVIVVGEMNDLETARLAVSAAETGHLVFATLHTSNAVRSINRLLDIFPSEEQSQVRGVVAESLRGIVSQQLVPRRDVHGLIPVVEVLVVTPAIRNLIRDQKMHHVKNAMKISKESDNMLLEDYARRLLQKNLISEQTFADVCES